MSAGATDRRDVLARALAEIRDLRARLAEREGQAEAVAVVGIGCRFPGAHGPDSLWRLMMDGVDVITEVPPDRWDVDAFYDPDPDAPGRMATRWGGFLEGVDRFDAAFFGISPREAVCMDPRQRLLLEVAYEALEDAGQAPQRLAGSATGVFVGLYNDDYAELHQRLEDAAGLDIYSGTGASHSVAAGRLSYHFDFHGPSLALDTACSSSLVAVHLACRGLRARECDLALAGGVNLVLSPRFGVVTSRMRMMAADGRCKAFDARADGFVRGEGCGMVVLKRLSDALAAGDPVRAVIRGTAVAQDGRTHGLTAPSGPGQERVIRAALRDGGVDPARVAYVEAHGTGTALGDPIEMHALSATYGRAPRQVPCSVGSVKTNLGHTEAAAGVAGLIKTVLALQHGRVPATLHFQALNPQIAADGGALPVAARTADLPSAGGVRAAAVSAFGWSGTNAHAVLESAPPVPSASSESTASFVSPALVPLSAHTAAALAERARGIAGLYAEGGGPLLADLCHTTGLRRDHHRHRLALRVGAAAEVREALEAFVRGEPSAALAAGAAPEAPPRCVLVFGGQGGQWAGMGRGLLEMEPVFADALARCGRALAPHTDFDLLDVVRCADVEALERVEVVQPVLFALQVALAELLRTWGMVPDAVIGHSMGEVAAAHVAGMLSLEDAARVIARRSALLRQIRGRGAMAVVELAAAEAEALVAPFAGRVVVAARNSRRATVLSGDPQAVEEVLEALAGRGVFCRRVKVDVASHGPQVEVLRAPLLDALREIRPRAGTVPMWSTVLGREVDGRELDASYWVENLRRPVAFAEGVETLVASGAGIFIEVGPHPVLLPAVADGCGSSARAIATLRREEDERGALLLAAGEWYCAGRDLDWERINGGGGRFVPLPLHPWQRERFWPETSPVRPPDAVRAAASASTETRDDALAGWLHEVRWEDAPPAVPAGPVRAVIFADRGGVGRALAAEIERGGGSIVLVDSGDAFARTADGFRVRVGDAEDAARMLAEAGGARWDAVIHLGALDAAEAEGLDADSLEAARRSGVEGALAVAQAMARTASPASPRLWLVTRGARAAADGDGVPGVAQAPLWGLARSVATEQPELRCTCVDLGDPSPLDAARLAAEVAAGGSEDQVAIRGSRRRVPRLRPAEASSSAAPFRADPDGTWLIAGGMGGIARVLVPWLLERGARSFALLGRRGPEAAARAWMESLERRGARVLALSADVADEAALAAALERIDRELPPLRGVVHAAVALEDALLPHITRDALARVMAPKADGAWNLHRLLAGRPLDAFILFSSAAAVLGTAGQAGYAAANAFQDALAEHRRARGLPALAVAWGPWAEVGQAAAGTLRGERLADRGVRTMAPALALEALGRLLEGDAAYAAVLSLDAARWAEFYPHAARSPFLSALGSSAPAAASVEDAPAALRDELAALEPRRRRAALESRVRGEAARVLRIAPERVEHDTPLKAMGVDSLLALELRNRLEAATGLTLPTTLVWAHPTVAALAAHLEMRLGFAPEVAIPVPPVAPRVREPAAEEDGVAALLRSVAALDDDGVRQLLREAR